MGNIYSPRLIVEEGAIIEGSCSMIKERETSDEEEAAASGYASPGEESAAPGLYDSAESADAELTEEIDDGDQDEESAGAARV
jgi:cytoskeletal protein CcmA (bactofilin family)